MFIRYTVKSGDMLSAIAKDQLGDAKRLNEITDENLHEIKDKNLIRPHQILSLPDDFHGDPEIAGEHIVPGDTSVTQVVRTLYTGGSERLTKIADVLAALNNLSATAPLGVGERLKVPQYAGLKDVPLQPVVELPNVELPSDYMAAFDAGYQPLYQAVADANPPDVSFLVDPLLNYCNASIDAALAWLTADESQLSAEVRAKLSSSQQSWQQFLDDSDGTMQTLIDPIILNYANDSGFRQPDSLVTATLLRTRYAQLNRLRVVQQGILADETSGILTDPKFKDISVGKDGSLWAIGAADDTIYRLYGDAGYLGWSPNEVGKAERIAAVDWGNAWCINAAGEIWQVTDADAGGTSGTWTQIPTHSGRADAKTIAVGGDGSAWYTQADGTTFRRYGDAEAVGWVPHKSGKAESIAPVDWANAWYVNEAGEIWRLDNAVSLEEGGVWTQVPTYSGNADAKSIAAGNEGSVWYVDTSGAVYFWLVSVDAWSPAWDQSQVGSVDVITVLTQAEVWCLNNAGAVWRTVDTGADGYQWQQVVEIGPDDNDPFMCYPSMTYTVQPGDNLSTIVRSMSGLTDLENSQQISQLVDQIVADNRERIPHLTRKLIRPGDVLTLPFFDSGCGE